jgi:hypothetical protein
MLSSYSHHSQGNQQEAHLYVPKRQVAVPFLLDGIDLNSFRRGTDGSFYFMNAFWISNV